MKKESGRLRKEKINDAVLCGSNRGEKPRLLLLFALCIILMVICLVENMKSTSQQICHNEADDVEEVKTKIVSVADKERFVPFWAFYNDGSYSYEDNDLSWYSGKETVHAVEGIDINLLPVREKDYTFKRQCVVALIDTGIDITHKAFSGRLWKNDGEIEGDEIDNDGNGFVDDKDGWNFYKNSNVMYNSRSSIEDAHGTHLAGTIVGNDADAEFIGVAGDIPSIHLMPVKTVGGQEQSGSIENLLKGIKYAEENGADICNISLGFEKWNDDVYQTMRDSNMLFVVVAGNGGGDTYGRGVCLDDVKEYPACFELENVIVVANLKCDGKLHYSSNYSTSYVDIATPGTQINSTSTHKSGYEVMTGTSMAAPMVSAAAALVYSEHTDWSLIQVKQAILSSVYKLDSLEDKVRTGGILDVAAAMEYKQTCADKSNTEYSEEEKQNNKKVEQAEVKIKKTKWYYSGKNKNHLVFQMKGNVKTDGFCLKVTHKNYGKTTVITKYISVKDTKRWKKVRLKINSGKGSIVSVKIQMYHIKKESGKKEKQIIGKSKVIYCLHD